MSSSQTATPLPADAMSATTPRDPYEVLGIGRDAGEQDVKKAFRRLARELHPDVNAHDPQAEEKFKQAAEAYEILSDPERRATYDRFGHDGLRSGGFAPNFDAFGSIGDLFNAFFGGSGPFGAPTRPGEALGGDIAVAAEIDLHDAFTGRTIEVRFEAIDRCEHCHGNGAEPGTPIERCSRCGGAGQLQSAVRTPFGQMLRTVVCDACHGDGRLPQTPCGECRGRGRLTVKRTEQVAVPAGIADGQRIRVSGRGHAGERGAAPGDLYLLLRVAPDERFVREGDDLITAIDVPAPLAALGTTVQVPTIEDTHQLEIPAGTQPGEIVTLRGLGMPALRGRRHGDLQVVVNVVVPRALDGDQRELLARFSDTLGAENLRQHESMLDKLRRALRHVAP
jgi:molecular chaperone DnaJ